MTSKAEFRKEAWRVHPVLDMPGLFPPAVMFGILEIDPRPRYRVALQRISRRMKQQDVTLPPETTSGTPQALLSAAWDTVFHDVPGDRIALLFHGGDEPGREAPGGRAISYSVVVGSTAPARPRWLATRALRFGQRAVCWCLPVDVEKGKTTEISLSAQNLTNLEEL